MRNWIYAVLSGQFYRSLPQRLRQLRPPRLGAAELLQLALELENCFRNRGLLFRFTIRRLRRLTELNRRGYLASRTLPGNSH